MNIIIGGGSGFIGRMLIPALIQSGNEITVISRNHQKAHSMFPPQVKTIDWNDLSSLDSATFDAIINLTGANIAGKRWNEAVKAEILSSRVDSVSKLIAWCEKSTGKKPHLYNASAIGYYGLQSTIPLNSPYHNDVNDQVVINEQGFCRQLVKQWEAAALIAEKTNIPLTLMRFGVALHRGEGMLKQLELPAKLGMSAVLGTGSQPLSWVSADDLVAAIVFLLAHPNITGAVNIVAPEVVTQKAFTVTMAKIMHRPQFLWMPAKLVNLLFGEMAEELLLAGQAVSSERLLQAQFKFKYPTLKSALEHEFADNI